MEAISEENELILTVCIKVMNTEGDRGYDELPHFTTVYCTV